MTFNSIRTRKRTRGVSRSSWCCRCSWTSTFSGWPFASFYFFQGSTVLLRIRFTWSSHWIFTLCCISHSYSCHIWSWMRSVQLSLRMHGARTSCRWLWSKYASYPLFSRSGSFLSNFAKTPKRCCSSPQKKTHFLKDFLKVNLLRLHQSRSQTTKKQMVKTPEF